MSDEVAPLKCSFRAACRTDVNEPPVTVFLLSLGKTIKRIAFSVAAHQCEPCLRVHNNSRFKLSITAVILVLHQVSSGDPQRHRVLRRFLFWQLNSQAVLVACPLKFSRESQ